MGPGTPPLGGMGMGNGMGMGGGMGMGTPPVQPQLLDMEAPGRGH